MSDSLYLVSCVSTKRASPLPARDLYVSPLFVKARAFVEARNAPWFILSAEYGLLDPNTVVAPYERTLNRMRLAERRAWADGVLAALGPRLRAVGTVVFLAGKRYREFLEPALSGRVRVEVPMADLGIGKQLQWLTLNLEPR